MNDRIEDIYPLAPGQSGILFQSLRGQHSGAYVIQILADLRGKLDPAREAAAWNALVARHGALRTAFAWKGLKQPLQIVGRKAGLRVTQRDLTLCSEAEQTTQFEAWLAQDRRAGFDLSHAPLLRVCRFTLGQAHHRLVISFHHGVLDGWSIPVLLRDWLALYRGASLAPAPPFREFIAWAHHRNSGASARFWQAEMSDLAARSEWPLPPPDSPPDEGRGDMSVTLEAEEIAALDGQLRPHGLTRATAVQGLWAMLLARLSGQDEVIYGLARAGRPPDLPGAEERVGMYLNTLPVRVRAPGSAACLPWLKQLQSRLQLQRPHEFCPLAEVQRAAQRPSLSALFDSAVIFENYPTDPSLLGQVPDLRLAALEVREQTSLPLSLFAIQGDGLRLRLLFDATQIAPSAAASLLADLKAALLRLSDAPQTCLGAFALTTPAVATPPAPPDAAPPPAQPVGNTAQKDRLAALWQEILHLPAPPASDANFFDLGGHSLLVISLQEKITEDFGLPVEIADLFRCATLGAQAAHLAQLSRTSPSPHDTELTGRIDARASGKHRLRQRRNRTTPREPSEHV